MSWLLSLGCVVEQVHLPEWDTAWRDCPEWDWPDRSLEPSTERVDFGEVELGKMERVDITLKSTGTLPIEEVELELWGQDSEAFQVDLMEHSCENWAVLEPGCELSLRLRFRPEHAGVSKTSLVIRTDDPRQAWDVVTLEGEGLGEDPPPAEDPTAGWIQQDRTACVPGEELRVAVEPLYPETSTCFWESDMPYSGANDDCSEFVVECPQPHSEYGCGFIGEIYVVVQSANGAKDWNFTRVEVWWPGQEPIR